MLKRIITNNIFVLLQNKVPIQKINKLYKFINTEAAGFAFSLNSLKLEFKSK